jgi:very-short-patch-repair endonuclease
VAADTPPGELARIVHEADVRFGTKPHHVEAVLERRPNAKGANALKAILRNDTPVLLSHLERAFIALLRRERLPLPQTNKRAGAYYVDCRWPDHNLTVELDSYAFHNTRHAWENDRQREREARRREDRLLRYTYDDILKDPDATSEELRPLLTPAPAAPSSTLRR